MESNNPVLFLLLLSGSYETYLWFNTTLSLVFNLTYSSVTVAGITSVVAVPSSASGHIAPQCFNSSDPEVYYNLTTNATISGPSQICLPYTAGSLPQGTPPQLYYLLDGVWYDITTSYDLTIPVVCGRAPSIPSNDPVSLTIGYGFQATPIGSNILQVRYIHR